MKHTVLVLSFLILAFTPLLEAQAKLRLNFNQCVEYALRNNDEIRATKQDIKVSEAKLIEARPKGIPVIKYESRLAPVPKDVDHARESFFDGEISPFASFKIEFGSVLTTFGKIRTAQELASIGIDASILKKKRKEDEIILKVYQVYQGVLLARELLVLTAQAQKALNDKIKDLENDRIKDQLQILKLKVALFEVDRRAEEAERKGALALATLRTLIGLEPNVSFDIQSTALTPTHFKMRSLSHFVERSKNYLPEYELLRKGVGALEKKLKLEKLAFTPNLGFGGFFDIGRAPNVRGTEDESAFTNPFNFTKAGAGLALKGNFDFVKRKAKVKEAESELLKNIYNKRAAERGLHLKLEKVYYEVQEASNLMHKANEEKKIARQMVFLTKSNLDIGLGEKKDYLDALQSYLVFQGRQFESIFNYNLAVASIKVHIGELYSGQRKDLSK